MYSDAKECVELGGEDDPNSDMGTQDLVKRVCIQSNSPRQSATPGIFVQTRYHNSYDYKCDSSCSERCGTP